MRAALDNEILPKLANGEIRVHVSGHADRIGNPDYNQKLSERRADALRAYLVEKGVEESKIEIFSYGTTLPAKDCGDEKGPRAHRMPGTQPPSGAGSHGAVVIITGAWSLVPISASTLQVAARAAIAGEAST